MITCLTQVLNAPGDAAADGNVIIISIRLSTIILLVQITSKQNDLRGKKIKLEVSERNITSVFVIFIPNGLCCRALGWDALETGDDSLASLFKI